MIMPVKSLILSIAIAAALPLSLGAQQPEVIPDLILDRKLTELARLQADFKQNPRSPDAARKVAQAMTDLGRYYAGRGQKGDIDRAFTYFNASLELRELVHKITSGETAVARALSASLNELATFLIQRGQGGDLEKAHAHYSRSLELIESLLKKQPDSADIQRDTAVSLERMGSLLMRRAAEGDGDKALACFTRALELTEKLRTVHPDSPDATRDLALSLERLGTFLHVRGNESDETEVQKHLTRSLELREEVVKKLPTSELASQDLSVSHEKLGDFLFERGNPADFDKARTHFTRSLELREGLLKAAPNNAAAARSVCVALNKLADFLATLGKPEDAPTALKHFTRDLEISTKLLDANPTSAQAARDVVVSRYKLAKFNESIGKSNEAEKQYRECYELLKRSIEQKLEFDEPMLNLFENLKAHLTSSGK
jgi:tetratricopeptide (TPR) repeat protein